jgi:iron(III) transport system permease protein
MAAQGARAFPGRPGTRESGAVCLCWACCLGFIALFIVYPLARAALEAGGDSWRRVFASSRWAVSAGHTLLLAVISTASSILAGSIYAYACARGGIPLARFFSVIPVLNLVTPPSVGGLSFMLLFGRQGFFTKTLFHRDISLYGLPGLVIAQTLCFFPLAFLIMRDAFDSVSPSLEYAARDAGAGRFRVFRTITLPLSAGGLLSAALFIAISVLSDFGNPALIGGRFNVLAVDLYTQLTGWTDRGTSAVLGIILLVPAAVLFAAQRVLESRKRASPAALRESAMPLPLPPLWARALLLLFCALTALIVTAQFLAVAGGAFAKVWGADSSFTMKHLASALAHKSALANTFAFALIAALAAPVIAAFSAFFSRRTNLPFRAFAEGALMLPASVPGSLTGLAFVLAFSGPVLRLTGTRAVIPLVMIVCGIPAAYRILAASVSAIQPAIDDSARSLGASRLRLFFDCVLPLVSRGMASAFVFTFVRAAGTLSAVIFLVTFKTKLVSVTILNLATQGDWGAAAALSLILTAVVFAALGALRLIAGFSFKPEI